MTHLRTSGFAEHRLGGTADPGKVGFGEIRLLCLPELLGEQELKQLGAIIGHLSHPVVASIEAHSTLVVDLMAFEVDLLEGDLVVEPRVLELNCFHLLNGG